MGLNPVPKVFCGSSLGLILNNIVSILVVLVGVTYNFLGWYGLDPLKKASLSPPYLYYIKIFSGGADCSRDVQPDAAPHQPLYFPNQENFDWDHPEARRGMEQGNYPTAHCPQHDQWESTWADYKTLKNPNWTLCWHCHLAAHIFTMLASFPQHVYSHQHWWGSELGENDPSTRSSSLLHVSLKFVIKQVFKENRHICSSWDYCGKFFLQLAESEN